MMLMAKKFNEDGQVDKARQCLEAEVQKNAENAEAWRMLGQIFQEFDQDDQALVALKNSFQIDPYDLDSVLQMGISCTNELDTREALKHLQNWLKYNPDFSHIPAANE